MNKMNWKQVVIAGTNDWNSDEQKALYDTLQARITKLEARRKEYDAIVEGHQNEPLTTIIDWGNLQQVRGMLLMEEYQIRQDAISYLKQDRTEKNNHRSWANQQFEVAKQSVLTQLKSIGYTPAECLQGSDILLRHPSVKAMRIEAEPGFYDNGTQEMQDAIYGLETELQTLRNRQVI